MIGEWWRFNSKMEGIMNNEVGIKGLNVLTFLPFGACFMIHAS